MLSASKLEECLKVHGTACLSRFGQSFCNVPTYTTPFGGEFRQVTWSIISGVRVCGCARASVGPQNHTMQHMCRAWNRTWLEEERLLTKGCKQQWANARQLDLFQTRLCGLETINGLFV